MRKKSVASISLVASLALVLAGCNMPTTTVQETSMMESTSNIEASNAIAAAMANGGTLKCEITNPTTGDSFTYLIKGKKMRVSTITADTTQPDGNMINDTEYLYIWNNDENNGVKMRAMTEAEVQQAQDNAQSPAANVPDFSSTEVQEAYQNDGYTITCDAAVVSDTDFVPPPTVTFQDMSAMMDAALQQSQQMQGQVQMQGSQGVGAGTPSYPGY